MILQEQLLNSDGFRRQMHALTIESVRESFPKIRWVESLFSEKHDWPHLLLSASYLAQHPTERAQATALRIAHHCLTSTSDDTNQKIAAALILDLLTNFPSLGLAVKKNLIKEDFLKEVSFPLRLDSLKRKVGFSIFQGQEILYLNRFQKDVFDALEDADCLSVSAPTSAGKSFVLEQFIYKFISSVNLKNIIFVVPTRALIQQVESDLLALLAGLNPKPIVSAVPQMPRDWKNQSNVFVYTQERLQWLLNDAPTDFAIDLLVVDEAQKIGDGARGVLLQQVIETVILKSPKCRVVFSSPMSSNPEILFKHVSRKGVPLISELVTVNQNLIWVSQMARRSTSWVIELCLHGNRTLLGEIQLPQRPTDALERLTFVAQEMSDISGGSLIYVNGQADAEKAAIMLSESITERTIDSSISNLMDLIAKTIHPQYALLNTLPRGVAFHYGNIPLLIRTEIERLFKEGKIKFLVCTSTLIEGVNLPARSIFVRRPTKGRGKPMDEIDFWNMAGRAGRLGKEFQGNIVCVDPDDWANPPPNQRKRYSITRTLDVVTKTTEPLLRFIDTGKYTKEGPSKQALEHTFSYFYIQFSRHGSIALAPFLPDYSTEILHQLDQKMKDVSSKISLPLAVLDRNLGVSPLAQQSLLQYFNEYKKPIIELIPALPESDGAYISYIRLLKRIAKHLSGDHPGLIPYYAVLVINWMCGYPLARIINGNIKYWAEHPEKNKKLAAIIRETMDHVEDFARFKFAKYSSCYVDILRFFLRESGKHEYLDQIPPLNIWLEFGVSQQTQISLMGIGLSRQTAISVSEMIPRHDLVRDEVIDWIKKQDIETLELSPIIVTELMKVREVLK